MPITNGHSAGYGDSSEAIDTARRPLKVIVIGAGISGILNAIKLPRTVANLELVIYEKNDGLGETWLENRYPGVACDIPAHMYQLSWDHNPAWSEFYASGPEILKYWQRVAKKYDLLKYMRFFHKVVEARWNAAEGKWVLQISNLATGASYEDRADAIVMATGVLNNWEWPAILGLEDFKGALMHSAKWDEAFDPTEKTAAVIGAGSSGIQIVPKIQPKVRRLDHYVRGSTWISTTFASQELVKRGAQGENYQFEPREIEAWQKDRQSYLDYRKQVENTTQSGHDVVMMGSESQIQAQAYFEMVMAQRLSKKPELLKSFLPSFAPLCKRLTPGPGYLESLTEDNVDVVTDGIERITETGILGKDGKQRDVDAIICATGFNTHFTNMLPVYGVDGVQLFTNQSSRQRVRSYVGMMTDGFPNLFMLLGPNSGVGHGNLLMVLERTSDYVAKALRKMQMEDIATIQPSLKAVDYFTSYCDEYFKKTAFAEKCSSWYKTDGRVTALWPGSSLHAIKALEQPRWEDFDFVYKPGKLGWLGDGTTRADHDDSLDKSYYLTSLETIYDDLPTQEHADTVRHDITNGH